MSEGERLVQGSTEPNGESTLSKQSLVLVVIFLVGVLTGVMILSFYVSPLPESFVYLSDIDDNITEDIRYFSSNNFVGHSVNGYDKPKCILTHPAAQNLSRVNQELFKMGFKLKVYDCYRPQRAVDAFIAWSENSDMSTQAEYYPHYASKQLLFDLGYIAKKSGHSRGSTVDLTIIPVHPNATDINNTHPGVACFSSNRMRDDSIDMGTNFDCMDVLSHTNASVTDEQKRNRQLLVQVMEAHNFVNYANEWWHFTLKDEIYLDTFFDFVVW